MIDLFKRAVEASRKPRIIEAAGVDGLAPERIKELEAQVIELRLNGREQGAFLQHVRRELLNSGHDAPLVIEDEATETTAIPASTEGLFVHVASWDSLLLDEELQALRNITAQM